MLSRGFGTGVALVLVYSNTATGSFVGVFRIHLFVNWAGYAISLIGEMCLTHFNSFPCIYCRPAFTLRNE